MTGGTSGQERANASVNDKYSSMESLQLSHGSLAVLEAMFGDALHIHGLGLTPRRVAAARPTKLHEFIEQHAYAHYWIPAHSMEGSSWWLDKCKAELNGRTAVPATTSQSAKVWLSLYADSVAIEDPICALAGRPQLFTPGALPYLRHILRTAVSELAQLAPLIRSGKVVLVSHDTIQALTEVRVRAGIEEEMGSTLLGLMSRAQEEGVEALTLEELAQHATLRPHWSLMKGLLARHDALALSTLLDLDLFDLVRDGNGYPLPRDTNNFTMRRLYGASTLVTPGLERMPYREVLAIATHSEAAAQVRAAMGPLFDSLPESLSETETRYYLNSIVDEQLRPGLARLEKEVSAIPGADAWIGTGVALAVPIVELKVTGTITAASLTALIGAPLPLLAQWVTKKAGHAGQREARRVMATIIASAHD